MFSSLSIPSQMLSPSYPFYPSFLVIADDLICLQRNTLGSRIHLSFCGNEPPIVIDSNTSYSVAPLLSNIADVNVIAHSPTVDQLLVQLLSSIMVRITGVLLLLIEVNLTTFYRKILI